MSDGPPVSPDVVWQRTRVDRARRREALGVRGATIWFTGLPCSGKSTVAAAVEAALVDEGRPAYLLDGDNLRHGLNGDLGFSRADRQENVRRVGHVAWLLADAGVIAIASLVSPYAADRAKAREIHERDGLAFIEVYVDTPVEVCRERDPKGHYARATEGAVASFTGVSDPYEPPVRAEVVIDGTGTAVADAVATVLAALER